MSYKPNPNKIQIGMPVISSVYKLKGITSARIECINGMTRFIVWPKAINNKKPTLEILDAPDLKQLHDPDYKALDDVREGTPPKFELGEEVYSEFYNIKGVATEFVFGSGGDVLCCVVTAEEGKKGKSEYLPANALAGLKTQKAKKGTERGCMNISSIKTNYKY